MPLVVAAASLFGALPIVCAVAASAFYLPMLAALILRGVAFVDRYKWTRMRPVWDPGFVGGSSVAAFMQGTTVGAFVAELPMADGRFSGGPFFWAVPLLCGVGPCLSYAPMDAFWIVGKADGLTRDLAARHRRHGLPRLRATPHPPLYRRGVLDLPRPPARRRRLCAGRRRPEPPQQAPIRQVSPSGRLATCRSRTRGAAPAQRAAAARLITR